jgi:hypothetical protein
MPSSPPVHHPILPRSSRSIIGVSYGYYHYCGSNCCPAASQSHARKEGEKRTWSL